MSDFLLFNGAYGFEIIPISGISRIIVDKSCDNVEIHLSNGERVKFDRHRFNGALRNNVNLERLIYPEAYEHDYYDWDE